MSDTFSDLAHLPVSPVSISTYVLTVRDVKYRVRTNLRPEHFKDTRIFRNEQHLVDWLKQSGFAEIIEGKCTQCDNSLAVGSLYFCTDHRRDGF